MDFDSNLKKENQENLGQDKILSLMNFSPSRPDLAEANFNRHLNECKSIITFLGSFTDYSYIRNEINKHITNLISSHNE